MLQEFIKQMAMEDRFSTLLRHRAEFNRLEVSIDKPYFTSPQIFFSAESAGWVQDRTRAGQGVHEPAVRFLGGGDLDDRAA